MLIENNVDIYYHRQVVNTISCEGWVSGLICESKSGRQVIKGKVYVDTTGDADLAKYSSIPFEMENINNLQPVTTGFRVGGIDAAKITEYITNNREKYINLLESLELSTKIGGWIETLNPNEAWFNIAHIENTDITDSNQLTKAEIKGREKVQKILNLFTNAIPGFEKGYLIDTNSQIGGRDSRRIKGLYKFTSEDYTKEFEDSIARTPEFTGTARGYAQIPYRCLITRNGKNIIWAGRSISVEHNVFDVFRSIPCCIATGQAAGIAAAIASQNKDPYMGYVSEIDVKMLQDILLDQKALI